MPRYKRTAEEAFDMPLEPDMAPENVETLTKLRNMWEFASLMQYIFLFGHVVKIDDDLDVEDLEAECLKSTPSERLGRIGLQLLKYVSSHRGLTPEIFEEYTRRQYLAKAPQRNPFGDEEQPTKFNDLDICMRIRVLQQLSTWTLGNAERIRGMMSADEDHLTWRMEPLGWDRHDNAYFVLDDNRLYRRSDDPPPPPTPQPKAKAKSKSKGKVKPKSKATRSSKRRKVEESEDDEPETDAEAGAQEDTLMTNDDVDQPEEAPGFGFTEKTWSCVAITLDEYDSFLSDIFRTRDPNEKLLRKRIEEDVRPIIEKRNEALRQKQLKKIREHENVQKMATAKRSSRLAGKADKEREEREIREAEEKRQADLKMAREEEERQRRVEEGHESRRLTREQRLKEREVKRILHEEELKRLEEEAERAGSQDPSAQAVEESKRISSRQVATQKEQHKRQLEELAQDDGVWYFDCSVCGMNGENLDDGTHSLACDRCNVWQHSKCHGFTKKQAEEESFTFICKSCKRQEAEANKPKIPTLKLGKNRGSASPDTSRSSRPPTADSGSIKRENGLPPHVQRQLDGVYIPAGPRPSPGPFGQALQNGPSLSPQGQAQGPPGYRYPPVGNFAPNQRGPQQPWQGSPFPPSNRPPSSGYASSPPTAVPSRYGQPPHYQQHQYDHNSAVATAGGHPGYQPAQHNRQPNGFNPPGPAGQLPPAQPHLAQPYPSRGYHMQQSLNATGEASQRPPSAHQPPANYGQQHAGAAHLANGFQSPVKGATASALSPPQSYTNPIGRQQQPSPSLNSSPKATFPPPAGVYHQDGQSPMKSSPQQPYQRPQVAPLTFTQTPQQGMRPPSANGNHQVQPPPLLQTPQAQTQAGPANANGVAADGMAGPWPEGSKAIPKKHDQSPAPPSSSHTVGGMKIMPPVAALAPSPSQQAADTPAGNIPVKKIAPEMDGAAGGLPSSPAVAASQPNLQPRLQQ